MKGLLDEVVGIVEMGDGVVISQIRANTGGNTTFVKSYDGVTTSGGQNLMAELARLQKTNDTVDGPYDTVEITIDLDDYDKDPKSSADYESGLDLGYTRSITDCKSLQSYAKVINTKRPEKETK